MRRVEHERGRHVVGFENLERRGRIGVARLRGDRSRRGAAPFLSPIAIRHVGKRAANAGIHRFGSPTVSFSNAVSGARLAGKPRSSRSESKYASITGRARGV